MQSHAQTTQQQEEEGERQGEQDDVDEGLRNKDRDQDDLQTLADTFKRKLRLLSGSLENITVKATSLNEELGIADNSSTELAARLVDLSLEMHKDSC